MANSFSGVSKNIFGIANFISGIPKNHFGKADFIFGVPKNVFGIADFIFGIAKILFAVPDFLFDIANSSQDLTFILQLMAFYVKIMLKSMTVRVFNIPLTVLF